MMTSRPNDVPFLYAELNNEATRIGRSRGRFRIKTINVQTENRVQGFFSSIYAQRAKENNTRWWKNMPLAGLPIAIRKRTRAALTGTITVHTRIRHGISRMRSRFIYSIACTLCPYLLFSAIDWLISIRPRRYFCRSAIANVQMTIEKEDVWTAARTRVRAIRHPLEKSLLSFK